MITAWRLVRKIVVSGAFSGDGARLTGGRWNSKGVAVVYLSESLALASLELFVRLSKKEKADKFVAISAVIPDEVSIDTVDFKRLPKNWREDRTPVSTQSIGDQWVREGRTAVLRVPSVIVPSEFNLVLNPLHNDFKKIIIGNPLGFNFDPRLWK